MAKTIVYRDAVAGTVIGTFTADFAEFLPNWFLYLYEATDQRVYVNWAYPSINKITVSPVGIAYPGDATPGTGQKKVTIDFAGAPATVVMTRCDNVDFSSGWLVVTKGEHIIAWSPLIIYTVVTEPTT